MSKLEEKTLPITGQNKFNVSVNALFLNEKQLALRINMSVKWLRKCRGKGTGIPFHKFGYSVRYRMEDVLDFEARNRRSPSCSTEGSG